MVVQQVGTVPITVCPVTTHPAMHTLLVTLDDVEFITRSIAAFQDLEAVSGSAGFYVTISACITRVDVAGSVAVLSVALVAEHITCNESTIEGNERKGKQERREERKEGRKKVETTIEERRELEIKKVTGTDG